MLPWGNRNTQEPKLYGMHAGSFNIFTAPTLYYGVCAAVNCFLEQGRVCTSEKLKYVYPNLTKGAN